jgi:NCS1 family nucleobase:cation symporter-1
MLAAWYGMPLGWTFASVILGTLAGGILLAIMSVMGPKAGYPQMIIGKTPFGKVGGSIMSFLQWMNTTGWLVFNAIIAAAALALLTSTGGFITLGGISMGLYLIPILVVSVLVFLLALFGHGMVHRFEKAMSVIIGLLFLYITAVSFQKVSVMIFDGNSDKDEVAGLDKTQKYVAGLSVLFAFSIIFVYLGGFI